MADEKKKADKPDKSDEKPKKAPPSEEKGGGGEGGKAAKAAAPADGVKGPVFMGIIAGIIVFNLVAAVVLVNVLMPKKPKAEAAAEHGDTVSTGHGEAAGHGEGGGGKPVSHSGLIVTPKPIEAVINIAGTDGKRYLKVGVQLEFDAVKYKDSFKLLEEGEFNPKLKSLLIDQVSQMTMDELLEPDAKEKISKEYLRRVNSAFPEKLIQFAEVFLVDFLVQ